MTKQMRLHYVLNLAADAKQYLDRSSTFDSNNLIVSYRCSPSFQESQDSHGVVVQSLGSSEQGQSTAMDFSKLYSDFSRYTNQIYYLSRVTVSSQTDRYLLKASQLETAQLFQVELF